MTRHGSRLNLGTFLAAVLVTWYHSAAVAQPEEAIPTQGLAERMHVEPDENYERVLALTKMGPVVIGMRISFDGAPYRRAREALIDQELARADTDGDEIPTWDEALANGAFLAGRLQQMAQGLDEKQQQAARRRFLRQNDTDKDGEVARGEIRRLMAQFFGGPTFAVSGQGATMTVANDRTRTILDTDGDGVLSAEELSAAQRRLVVFDGDENERLDAVELGGAVANPAMPQRPRERSSGAAPGRVVLLGPAAIAGQAWNALRSFANLQETGISLRRWPTLEMLSKDLDTNRNGSLNPAEFALLDVVRPHLELEIDLLKVDGQVSGTIKVTALRLGDMPHEIVTADDSVRLRMQGMELVIVSPRGADPYANVTAQSMGLMTQFDADKNGYLEKKELGDNAGLEPQFAMWDEDKDDKVFAEELDRFFTRQVAPFQTMASIAAGNASDPLFGALDQNHDQRLGLREMSDAARQLALFDIDRDGRIAAEEIPEQLELTISRGVAGFRLAAQGGRGPATGASNLPDAPPWFVRTDRNGDGDLSPREFLGTMEQFQKLDTDADGLVSATEALALQAKQ